MHLVDQLYTKLTQSATVLEAEAKLAEATAGVSREEVVSALSFLLAIEHIKARYAAERLRAVEIRQSGEQAA